MKHLPIAVMATLLSVAASAVAADAPPGPRIAIAGHAVDTGERPAPSRRVRRILFNLDDDATLPGGTHRGLDTVARTRNLYALIEVPDDQVDLVVLLHGKATPLALRPDVYAEQFGRRKADAELIDALLAAGVRIEVCAQALHRQGFEVTQADPRITVQLSAILRREELLSDGFVPAP